MIPSEQGHHSDTFIIIMRNREAMAGTQVDHMESINISFC
jgi:hypothetical protein